MEEKKVAAQVVQEVTVNIKVVVNDRTYTLLIPAGVPYEEASVVALEMSTVIRQMQENSKKAAQEAETGGDNGQQ